MEIRTFSILAIIITSLALAIMPAYAENMIAIPAGSSVLGCEEKNECYIPYETKIANGSKITWSNDDHVAHTITSGTIKEGPDGIFDSGLFVSGIRFHFLVSFQPIRRRIDRGVSLHAKTTQPLHHPQDQA